MSRWKIWYCDGSTFSSADGQPSDAPCKDVACINVEDGRCGRRRLRMMDWYRWDEDAGRWFECEQFDVLLHLTRHGTVTAKRGAYMPEKEFEKLLIASHEDTFVPTVSPKDPPHEAWKKVKGE